MEVAESLIEVENLHHTYGGNGSARVHALRGISLTLRPGEFVALVGANGSGKTTLARHLNALLLPTDGQVRIAGRDTRDRGTWPAIRSQVAMVFQRPEDQIVATTVEDDVAFGPENLGVPAEEIERRVRWALETVQMSEWRHRPPHLLSAGQQQRVAIAGALAMHPRCLVLDEATAMLDPAGREAVLALAHQLHAEGITIVLITHAMDQATQVERVIALNEGRIAFDGPPRRIFSTPELLGRTGLEPPPVAVLAQRLSGRWPGFPGSLLTTEELADALTPRLSGLSTASPSAPPTDSSRRPGGAASGPVRSDGEPLLATTNLRHTYLAGTPLTTLGLDRVSLEVYAGEVAALLGPTGSGKSTLLQLAAGLLRPEAGEVLLAGRDVNGADVDHRVLREQVGMLFQRPEEQLFETYVGDDVAFGPRQLGLDHGTVRERVRWAMETVGLPFGAYKDRFTQGLSGGERRKAALAGVLALRPRMLLLDEPTAGLDPQTRRTLLATLQRLTDEEGMTMLIATHNMDDVAALAGRVYVLEDGRIALQGTTREVFARADRLGALGLDLPAAVSIMATLRERGLDVPSDILTLEEAEETILFSYSAPSELNRGDGSSGDQPAREDPAASPRKIPG
ncbi:MAG: energy-coupling factor transporter ATPase [Anaerolineae bacterium]|jgi:energy-coupling factor transport system ATP-binding protein